MNDVKPYTTNEINLCKGIQRAIGAYDNGIIGAQTLTDIAAKLGAECFPLTVKLYGHPAIIANDIIAFKAASGVSAYKNSISGSFTYPSGKTPCSILVQNGTVVCGYACHALTNDKPETVIYRTISGAVGIRRVKTAAELGSGIKWAVGGMGLLDNYDPAAEGFTGAYADVVRKTNHTVLGTKNGKIYLMYLANMTGAEVNAFVRDKQICDKAIMLDGGHIAAINGTESFAQINTKQMQGYILQGI